MTFLEQKAELEKKLSTQDKLTGLDYITVPVDILVRHKDFTQHAYRVIQAISKMTSTQIENINLNPSGRAS